MRPVTSASASFGQTKLQCSQARLKPSIGRRNLSHGRVGATGHSAGVVRNGQDAEKRKKFRIFDQASTADRKYAKATASPKFVRSVRALLTHIQRRNGRT